jgi:DNA-binding GntR family transcriptional regulator
MRRKTAEERKKPGREKTSRVGTVYNALKRAILEQGLGPGDKLPEDAIGEQFGVSRTIVHEALVRLAGDRLVELRRNRGAQVASPSLDEGRELFNVRYALEKLVVETLCGTLTSDQLERLAKHVQDEEDARGRSDPRSIRLAGEFHTILADMTGNATLIRFVGEVIARCSLIISLYGRPHSAECAISEHRAIVAALQAGDAAKASSLMHHHLSDVMNRALLPQRPQRNIREILAAYSG